MCPTDKAVLFEDLGVRTCCVQPLALVAILIMRGAKEDISKNVV